MLQDYCSSEICLWNKPAHDKTNEMTCAPREDSDQLGHSPSLISLRCMLNRQLKDPRFLYVDGEESDRLGRCPGSSQSLLGARVILLVLLCGGTNHIQIDILWVCRVVAPIISKLKLLREAWFPILMILIDERFWTCRKIAKYTD